MLKNRGIKIEVFLGSEDKIINSKDAFDFFSKYATTYLIKKAGHLLDVKKINSYVLSLWIFFGMVWIWSSISPISRYDWILENILVVIILSVLFLTYKKFKFSDTSYVLIIIFF